MDTTSCFECGQPAHVQHHVIPQSRGGTKTVPLCNGCHSLVHDAKLVHSQYLIDIGKQRVREIRKNPELMDMIKSLPKSESAKRLKINRKTVYYLLEELGLHKNEGRGCDQKITPELLDNIKQLRENGASWNKVEKETGLSHTHLYRIIKEFGWYDGKYGGKSRDRDSYRTLTPDKVEEAKRLREQGKTWEEVAATLGVDRTTLYKHGVAQQYKPLRGKITPEKKELAIKLKREGKSWKEIAAELGVSIGAIFSNKIHKQV